MTGRMATEETLVRSNYRAILFGAESQVDAIPQRQMMPKASSKAGGNSGSVSNSKTERRICLNTSAATGIELLFVAPACR